METKHHVNLDADDSEEKGNWYSSGAGRRQQKGSMAGRQLYTTQGRVKVWPLADAWTTRGGAV